MEKNRAFFPLFVDLTSKKILVVGGGTVAARRIESLLDFTEDICLLSPEALLTFKSWLLRGGFAGSGKLIKLPAPTGTRGRSMVRRIVRA